MESPNDVVANGMCVGCGGCTNLGGEAVVMRLSDAGFYRPEQKRLLDEREKGIFARSCPGVVVKKPIGNSNESMIWGRFERVSEVCSTDDDILQLSSSGGGITSLTLFLLEKGIVDGVVHTIPKSNFIDTVPVVSLTKDDLLRARGSRYSPSSPLNGLRSQLESGKRYVFVGKPCDIVALNALCENIDWLSELIYLKISFFCAGVPSQHASKKLIDGMGVDSSTLVDFRYRGDGWPGFAIAADTQGNRGQMTYEKSWGTILNRDLQSRCRVCIDGVGEAADISFGDSWASDAKGYPIFEEKIGKSLAICRTPLGRKFLGLCISEGYMTEGPKDVGLLRTLQKYQYDRRGSVLVRLFAYSLFGIKTTKYEGYPLIRLGLELGVVPNLKYFAGTLKRLFKKKKLMVN